MEEYEYVQSGYIDAFNKVCDACGKSLAMNGMCYACQDDDIAIERAVYGEEN